MIGFLSPLVLLGLLVLPVLWWLLRAVPPAPVRRRFPGVLLLLGLPDTQTTPDRTPWWLLLLRITALAAAIVGFARPVLNAGDDVPGNGPLMVLFDGGWASAPDWPARVARLDTILSRAARDGRPVLLHRLADPPPADAVAVFGSADQALDRLRVVDPAPWPADRAGFSRWLERAELPDRLETIWLTDAQALAGDNAAAGLADVLAALGPLAVIAAPQGALALGPAEIDGAGLAVPVLRPDGAGARAVTLLALGPGPDGTGPEAPLWRAEAAFAEGETSALARFDMPVELRNRVRRIVLTGQESAGATLLADDGLSRRKVGLYAPSVAQEGPQLVAPLFYLSRALGPLAEVTEAGLPALLATRPDVLILADMGRVEGLEAESLLSFVRGGGVLVRFAGPRLARAAAEPGLPDPLLPVRLRAGGRALGGAMTWPEPRSLAPFPDDSPFAGLVVPGDVTVSAQVLAQPDPDLPDRVIAMLDDGTPLVTARPEGQGRLILFHVTANAEWSDLPLSGLFVQMLERLAIGAGGGGQSDPGLAGRDWTPVLALDGYGAPRSPRDTTPVAGDLLAAWPRSAAAPPGLFEHAGRAVAVNLLGPDQFLAPLSLPPGITVLPLAQVQPRPLGPLLIALAVLLLLADTLATILLAGALPRGNGGGGGRRHGPAGGAGAAVLLAALLAVPGPQAAHAQTASDDASALMAANNTVLAHVLTGDSTRDQQASAGLAGLGVILSQRTAIEPVAPMAVDVETDELAFFPFLYWPITGAEGELSDSAAARVNGYLRTGGMILFDTADAHLGGDGARMAALRRITAKLDIPPLAPIEPDHVLGRSFYLIEGYPGRWRDGVLWVEAPVITEVEGEAPFRRLNDGVTPVLIGSNDWAAAWALSASGQPLYPVGTGIEGERQREIARRFGVNLIMYVMTGNYKSDQVHIPALLERLGQ